MNARSLLRVISFAASLPLLGFATEASAASAGECRDYARKAVERYELARSRGGRCAVRTDGRWQANSNAHYGWCLQAQRAWLKSEADARTAHLARCGAIAPMANPRTVPID
jgi:hypothetical protein